MPAALVRSRITSDCELLLTLRGRVLKITRLTMRQRINIPYVLLRGAAILPALAVAFLIFRYAVDVPYWDQWSIAPFFVKFSRGTLTAADLFALQYEYREFFPNLIFVALGWLTRWDVRYEMLFSLALACLTSLCIYRMGTETIGGDRVGRGWLLLISNVLIFSTIQYMNWLSGIQIIYFMPVACLTAGLWAGVSRLDTRIKILLCMSLATVSTFSSANGMLCWVLLLPVLVKVDPRRFRLSKNPWWLLLWVAGFAGCGALYFYGYQKPAGIPSTSESLLHPVRAVAYFLSVMGAPLAVGRIHAAVIIGAVLVALDAAAWVWFLKLPPGDSSATPMLVWLMLGGYSCGTGVLVTVGRVGFGVEQSLSSRYTTFTLYLIVALPYLWVIILDARAARRRAADYDVPRNRVLRALAIVFVCGHLLITYAAIRQMSGVRIERLRLKACLLTINVVESECLTDESWPGPEFLRRTANELNELGLLRPALLKSNRVGTIDGAATRSQNNLGALENLRREGDTYMMSGRATLPEGREADAVLLAYENNVGEEVVFALSDMKATGHQSTGRDGGKSADASHWKATFPADALPPDAISLTAWAFDADTAQAYKLDGSQSLPRHE